MKSPMHKLASGMPAAALQRGAYIQASSYDRRSSHQGFVLDTVPDQGVLWIRDEITGLRKLIDSSEHAIVVYRKSSELA
ncbi:hypothetical protein [Arthrobacter sp. USHLN218]|uniref:hypothetical protein n=1 Tax=Arthrobacter sp. USHLN218 TaxID=3081232 RepID=UPI00301A0801